MVDTRVNNKNFSGTFKFTGSLLNYLSINSVLFVLNAYVFMLIQSSKVYRLPLLVIFADLKHKTLLLTLLDKSYLNLK